MSSESTHPTTSSLGDFERLLADASARLSGLRGEEVDDAIVDSLRALCRFLGADRSTLFEFSADGRSFEAIYWWAREGMPPIRQVEVNALPWYASHLRRGETLRLERLPDDLPPEATAERAVVARDGLKSNLTVPIDVGRDRVCALAAGAFREYRPWPGPLVERVRLFGQLIGAAVMRHRQERALVETQAEIERLNKRLARENVYLREEIRQDHPFDEIVGTSTVLRQALALAEQVAPTDSAVLLLGETGTGKELVARAIHDHSPRREGPLVKLNCAALPAGLVESELFGHEKGAFTGATAARAGRFEVADGGTLLLDEVGDLPLEAQAKLLRVLQEGELERLGSSGSRRVDVRVIAATHRDLAADVRSGRFRHDLYYRLNVFPIEIPPLRARKDDIERLVWFFIHHRQRQLGRRIEKVPARSLEALKAYDWPGNVRELENVIERAMILSAGDTLRLDQTFGLPARRSGAAPARDLDSVQRAHIEAVLAECGWKINGPGNAAERLALHPNTLRFRMKKLGIARPGRAPSV